MKFYNYFFRIAGLAGLLLFICFYVQFESSPINASSDGQSGIGRVGVGFLILTIIGCIFLNFIVAVLLRLLNKKLRGTGGKLTIVFLLTEALLGLIFIIFYLLF